MPPYAAIASSRAPPGQATQRTLAGVTYTHRPSGLTPFARSASPLLHRGGNARPLVHLDPGDELVGAVLRTKD